MHGIKSLIQSPLLLSHPGGSCELPGTSPKAPARAFQLSFLSLGWLYSLTELGRVKRQYARRRDLHTSEPQPEQTPQVTLETPSSGTLTAPSKSVCSKIISPASLLSWWSSLLFEVSYWLKQIKTDACQIPKAVQNSAWGLRNTTAHTGKARRIPTVTTLLDSIRDTFTVLYRTEWSKAFFTFYTTITSLMIN